MRVYIAGPYTKGDRSENVRNAMRAMDKLISDPSTNAEILLSRDDDDDRSRASPGGSSVLHAATKYRTEAREAYQQAQRERDPDKRRFLILRQQRLVRMAVDLEKKAGR